MTQPPGRHHDGDGCTGQPRPLDADATAAIRLRAKRLLHHAFDADWDQVTIHGDWVALHYGPPGEYYLSTVLASYIRTGNSYGQTRMLRLPLLSAAVPARDPEAAALFEYLASHRRLPRTPLGQGGDLEAARLPLQQFLLHLHAGDQPAAMSQWHQVYEHSRQHPHHALAFTALLIVWTRRALFGPTPRHVTAPLN